MSSDKILKILSGIRDSLFCTVEKEAFQRVENSMALSVLRKAEFTDELEGKLRNHW